MRLRAVRIQTGISQRELADRIGITRSTIANYEAAVTPVPYEAGKRICFECDVNQRWFATGKPPLRPYLDLSPHLEIHIKLRDLFSIAYDIALKKDVEKRIVEIIEIIGEEEFLRGNFDNAILDKLPLVGEFEANVDAFYAERLVRHSLVAMPDDLKGKFACEIVDCLRKFNQEHTEEIRKLLSKGESDSDLPQNNKKLILTHTSIIDSVQNVKPQLPSFLERLNKASAESGKKSELAKYLGAPLASVSRWLAGEREPGAETTLQLLKWVEQQERQK